MIILCSLVALKPIRPCRAEILASMRIYAQHQCELTYHAWVSKFSYITSTSLPVRQYFYFRSEYMHLFISKEDRIYRLSQK